METYYERNKERIKQKTKQYRINNPDKVKEALTNWRKKNPEACRGYSHRYKQRNKEKVKESQRLYKKTESGKKSTRIYNWKKSGLKEFGYTYDELYEYYLETNQCEVCQVELNEKNKRMDHCHETGCFRWILCHRCNCRDHWMSYF